MVVCGCCSGGLVCGYRCGGDVGEHSLRGCVPDSGCVADSGCGVAVGSCGSGDVCGHVTALGRWCHPRDSGQIAAAADFGFFQEVLGRSSTSADNAIRTDVRCHINMYHLIFSNNHIKRYYNCS